MKHLFDFGMSQEDASSEQAILNLQKNDRLLCIASAGEVPLNLLCFNKGIKIDAVDISKEQLALCRLKLITAMNIDAPANAGLLGYIKMEPAERKKIFREKILTLLNESDQFFWKKNQHAIATGVINCGRFELFLKKMRKIGAFIIGKKNIKSLINCSSIEEQKELFEKKIATRKMLKILFKVAFHPWVYKNRGVSAQGLIHASSSAGEIFFKKFKNFCTGSLAGENYFLQYFLLGSCVTANAIPEFLQLKNAAILKENFHHLSFKHISLQEALASEPAGTYNKVHLSNIGDWLTSEGFADLVKILQDKVSTNAKLSYRFLQKNHLENGFAKVLVIDKDLAGEIEARDRLPFYSILPISING
jgi:S-adenosylmethionine:diacylglycerol 3-amino-3-carboxypropyl transferase